MRNFKSIIRLACLGLISISFSQCASTLKLESEAPFVIANAYYQTWVAGVKGGGSGTNVFIETRDENSFFDSIYYQGKVAKLTTKPNNQTLFVGYFKSKANTKEFEIKDSHTEVGVDEEFLFELKDNECVISYTENGKTKYFKIEKLKEKPMEALPMSAIPKKN